MYHSDLIKVITGVRRCGKSVLLRQIMAELADQGITSDHLVYLNFEDYANAKYTDTDAFYQYLRERIIDGQRYYLFFDEIQQVHDFERVINSFRATENVSIFITGSNSQLLSGELATLLTGRYVSLFMLPFTFREFVAFRQDTGMSSERLFDEYLYWGGMPRVCQSESAIEKNLYIQDLYNTIALKDVMERGRVKNPQTLSKINQLLLTNLGKTISANSIVNYLKNEHLSIAPDTVINYISQLNQALLFNKLNRFDIKGKTVLRTLEKHYLADLCFLRLRTSQTETNPSGRLENIVCNELLSRHYQVYIGKTDKGEIDFAARNLAGEWSYFQVCATLQQAATRQREFSAFTGIPTDGKKIVLSRDSDNYSQGDIQHFNAVDWLLRPEKQAFY